MFIIKETKAAGTDSADVDGIAFDFLKRSYDTSKFPGIIDLYSGRWKNGRTRNSSGRKVGENWMPAAIFKFTAENEKLASISTGSKANSRKHHKTQHPNNLSDYEEQGVAAVQAGLSRTKDDLKKWFLEETDFAEDLGCKYAFAWAKKGILLEKYKKAEYYVDKTPSYELLMKY